jgi:hypothetical protein
MHLVKIKCGNCFSENEIKGHQPLLTVFHRVMTKKVKLQSFQDFSNIIDKVDNIIQKQKHVVTFPALV